MRGPEYWDERYAGERIWSAGPNRFIEEECRGLPPGRALDLGAGEGRNAIWLAERGWEVVAVDFSETGIDRGREAADRAGVEVEWIVEDVLVHEPEPAAFDLVVIAYLHLHRADLLGVFRKAARALAPGGRIVAVGHDRANPERGHGGPDDPEILYDTELFRAAFGALDLERNARVVREVETEEGTAEALDTLLVARKPLAGEGDGEDEEDGTPAEG